MTRRLSYLGRAAALVAGATLLVGAVGSRAQAQGTSVSTPTTPDGRPDLSGMWSGGGDGGGGGFTNKTEENGNIVRLFPSRRCAPNQLGCRDNTNQSNDGEFTGRTDPNRPLYKPEYWDRVQELDYNLNFEDPQFKCLPLGVPRVGPPAKIVQLPHEVIFFYASNADHDYRIIPTDGRAHDPDAFPTFYGDSVGRWEGDTLVIDVVSRNDTTWLAGGIFGGGGGYFHSFDLHVIERLRREGNTLHYQATVEDPSVLLVPWVMNARQLRLNPNPKATIREGLPCKEYESEIVVSRIRH
jgi:hypothetical protein